MKIIKVCTIICLVLNLIGSNSIVAQNLTNNFNVDSLYVSKPNFSFSRFNSTSLISSKLKVLNFNTYVFTQQITEQLGKFNLVISKTDKIRTGLFVMPF